jgi:type VI secretion system secreted protein Hcp
MPIFMQYDGIPGDVNSAGHEQWIEIGSFQWGIGRGIGAPTGGSSDREGSTPSVSEIVVTKSNDSASNNLMRAALGLPPAGEGKNVQVDFCKTNTDNPEVYLTILLENTLVSGWSVSSGGDRPTESVSLNFTKVTVTNTAMKAGNDPDSPDRAMYDLAAQIGS